VIRGVRGWPPGGLRGKAAVLSLLMLGLVVTGCSSDVSAPFFAKTPPSPVARVLQTGLQPPTPSPGGPLARSGKISRPDPTKTPGAIAETDVVTVCKQPRVHEQVPREMQTAVFGAYNIPFPRDATKYGLDYLVPIQLGGSPVAVNLWPVSRRGVGFPAKQTLNAKLRQLVCQGTLPLARVQKDIVADWYVLWLEYGAG